MEEKKLKETTDAVIAAISSLSDDETAQISGGNEEASNIEFDDTENSFEEERLRNKRYTSGTTSLSGTYGCKNNMRYRPL